MPRGVVPDRGEVLRRRRVLGEIAAQHVEAAPHGVHVRVLEPRHEHPSGEIDDLGARSDQVARIGRVDGDDATVRDGDRPRS